MQVVPGEPPRVVLAGPWTIPLEQGQRLGGPIVAQLAIRLLDVAGELLATEDPRRCGGLPDPSARLAVSPIASDEAATTVTARRITRDRQAGHIRMATAEPPGPLGPAGTPREDRPAVQPPLQVVADGAGRGIPVEPGRARGISGRSSPGRGQRPDGSCSAASAARLGPGPGSPRMASPLYGGRPVRRK